MINELLTCRDATDLGQIVTFFYKQVYQNEVLQKSLWPSLGVKADLSSANVTWLLMVPHLKCGTMWQPAAPIFQSCFCDLSQNNLHLNFNKQIRTFKVKFREQIHAELFSSHNPLFCCMQYKWDGGICKQLFAPINVKSWQHGPVSLGYKPVFGKHK